MVEVIKMVKSVFALSLAGACLAGAAFAAPGDKKNTKAKVTEVHVCPMTGEVVKGEGGGSSVVKTAKGTYKVDFCCASCKPSFDKLSQKDKEAKIADALKKHAKKG